MSNAQLKNVEAKLASMKSVIINTETDVVGTEVLFGLNSPLVGIPKLPVRKSINSLVPVVDKNYVFEPNQLRRILFSIKSRENIMLVGDKGTGKTTLAQQICARMGIPLMVINCGPGVDEDYLMGRLELDGQSTKPVDGLVSWAMRHGVHICLDEISTLKPGVLVAMNDVFESGDLVTLKHHGLDPETGPDDVSLDIGSNHIVRHPNFRIWATDNGGGKAVRQSNMAGINTISSAVRSRFTYFQKNHMPFEQELKALSLVVSGTKVPELVLRSMIGVCNRTREAFNRGEVMDTLSFRELKRWALKSALYGDFKLAFVDSCFTALEEPSKPFVLEAFEFEFSTPLELPSDLVPEFEYSTLTGEG